MSLPLPDVLDLITTAPGGVARLRELILSLAVRGKLVPQDPADEPASVLLKRMRAEKDDLVPDDVAAMCCCSTGGCTTKTVI